MRTPVLENNNKFYRFYIILNREVIEEKVRAMSKTNDLQNDFLTQLCGAGKIVSIYLVNGIKLQGHIESFDSFALMLVHQDAKQLVYKHAISTIVPGAVNAPRYHSDTRTTI
jgi:host factor-I protein